MEKTDLDLFIELYRRFGITIKHPLLTDTGYTISLPDDADDASKTSKKFNGYIGFCSDIKFDVNGKFILQGFWE